MATRRFLDDKCKEKRYSLCMIKSFRHAGLEKFFKSGSKAGIQPDHAGKLNRQLTRLNVATQPVDMNVAGWAFHRLSGNLKDCFAVSVNGNWRLTFKFEGEDAHLVDYQDYH
ncbi:MAG TPA: type II toxin-antitoxin system RelE/ParE family toxin [Terracidiphilus sp.]